MKRRQHGKAVEQMMRDHLISTSDRREVVGRIPLQQLVDEGQQAALALPA